MKLRKTFITCISLLLAGGAISSACLIKGNNNPIEVKAADSNGLTRIYLDLRGFESWRDNGAIFKFHSWSEATGDVYVEATKVSDDYYYADYDLSKSSGYRFSRFNPSDKSQEWTQGEWNTNKSSYYYQPTDWKAGNWLSPEKNWSVKGGVSPWTTTTIDDPISNVSFDSSGLQYYVSSYQLNANTEIKILGGSSSWYGYNSANISDLAKQYLSEGGNGNISVTKTGTFDIYCKPVEQSYWIQVDSLTEAKGFCSKFLDDVSSICSDTSRDNKSALQGVWSNEKNSFEALTLGAKAKFNSDSDSVVTEAREKYIHIIERYGLDQWNGATPVSTHNLSRFVSAESKNETISIGIVVSLVALTALGAFFYIRKRKTI